MKSKANLVVVKTETKGEGQLDRLKWILAFALLLAGLIANHYYSEISVTWRALVWVGVLLLAGWIASFTQKGRWVIEFFRDSRMELRKVVWPTREETLQTTLVVAAMVIVLALLLWGMDGILVWLIGWLTGQRG